jgi:filamentous hemagglutinin
MAGTIFSGTYLSGIYLNNYATENPETVAATGSVSNTGVALLAQAGHIWTVSNFGMVTGLATAGTGIQLSSGGSVANAAGGLVSGASSGVLTGASGGAGTVVNYGTIEALGTVTNVGGLIVAGNGINLAAGGNVQNGAAGSTSATIIGYHIGVLAGTAGNPTTVSNFGTIESLQTGTSGYTGTGLLLQAGGAITNDGIISAANGLGINIQNAAGTITNFGTIERLGVGTTGEAIQMLAGGGVTNYGLISGTRPGNSAIGFVAAVNFHNQPGTVRNFGTIAATNGGNGVNLLSGGTIVNGATGSTAALISGGNTAVYIGGTLGVPTAGRLAK